MQKIEIELKFELDNKNELISKLNKMAEFVTETDERDTYYVPAHKNFLSVYPVREWLRIRKTGDKVQLNYKDWHHTKTCKAISCDELESDVSDGEAVKSILERLDFKEIVVVDKFRKYWKFKDLIIQIDTVKELGDFLEVEADKEFSSIDEAKKYILQVVEELGVDTSKEVRKGYPFMFLVRDGIVKEE
ncbi:MAG: class IV adenylate cyclase [Nanoarchaeota archaeon]|nr:class IV adenylate cyclase [Nanoarchaeota archaeon]